MELFSTGRGFHGQSPHALKSGLFGSRLVGGFVPGGARNQTPPGAHVTAGHVFANANPPNKLFTSKI